MVFAALVAACGGDDGEAASVAAEGIDGVVIERVGTYEHIDADLEYDQAAPSGGDHPHAPFWVTCGVYEGVVPDELVVHSLEHGAVWIALGPGSTAEDRVAAGVLAEAAGKVIVSEVPDLGHPVELVAWGFRLPLDAVEDARAAAFVEAYVDGSSAPEAGASCQSELGDPPEPPVLPFG